MRRRRPPSRPPGRPRRLDPDQDGPGRPRVERAMRRLFQKRTGLPDPGEHAAEMNLPPWQTHLAALASAGLGGMTRRLPALIGAAARLAWRASPADTIATVTLHLLAGVFTAYGLLATTGVLRALFAGGATPDRVRAALPSLALVAGATALRAGLQAGAGWAQARLKPRVDHLVEKRLFDLTNRVELPCFDDTEFHDAMHRARDRGLMEAAPVVEATIDVLTGVIGLAAAAGALGVLHPVLLPLLLITAIPDGWAAARAARVRYLALFVLSAVRRPQWVLAHLLAPPAPAARIPALTTRPLPGPGPHPPPGR